MSVSPPALTITLGRGAYRWPLRVCLIALTAGLAVSLSTLSGPEAWDPGDARRTVAVYGGGGLAVALAAALWAFMIYRNRLVVTIGEKGLTLRRGTRKASIPADAVDAVGITWPVADPAWTVWFDPEAAPGVGAVTDVEGRAAVLSRDRFLPPGWLHAVHSAATEVLGATWRVLDDEGEEVGPPPEDALRRADHIRVDGTGRYRDRDGGVLLAVAAGRRPIALCDPHARTLLVFLKRSLTPGRDRMRVSGARGEPVGEIRGGHEPSFHGADGTLLGTTRQTGDRFVVTGVDGRESASLWTGGDAGDGPMRLDRSPSAPEALRTLALALPMVIRVTRRS